MGERFLEQLQDEHCDFTRTTRKRFRVLRNIGEAAIYYPEEEGVLCFGSGDGFELQVWKLLGFNAIGCEISSKKNNIAAIYGVESVNDIKSIKEQRNIYCAHTLEHVNNAQELIFTLWDKCLSIMCCIFPIEPKGSKNPSHLSPIYNLNQLIFPGKILYKSSRWNDEFEGIIICAKE